MFDVLLATSFFENYGELWKRDEGPPHPQNETPNPLEQSE
jgi:hypothetical protein